MGLNRTFPCVRDTWLVDVGGGAGNGLGPIAVVGFWNSQKNRSVFAYDCDFAGGLSVQDAEFVFMVDERSGCGDVGSAVRFYIETIPSFKEGDFGGACNWSFENAPGEVWPGPTSSTTNRVKYSGSPADGETIRVKAVAMLQAFMTALAAQTPPKTTGTLFVRLIAAETNPDTGYDELTAGRRVPLRTRHNASGKPRIEMVLDDNHPPSPPVITSPLTRNAGVSGEGPALVDGLVLRVKGRRVDLDAGDHVTGSEVVPYTEDADDDAEGNIIAGSPITGLTGAGQKTSYTGQPIDFEHVVSGFSPGQRSKYRSRTRDRRNVWGTNTGTAHGWTRLENGWVDLNTPPSKPTNLQVDPTDPVPDYKGSHVDVDAGSSCSAVETQVAKDTPLGIELIQNTTTFQPGDEPLDLTPYSTRNGSGQQSIAGGTAWTVTHAGRALQPGERIRRRHRTVDQFGRAGVFSDWVSWDVVLPTVPQPIPAAGVRQGTTTPPIGATYNETFDLMQLRGYTAESGGTQILDTGEVVVSPAALTKSRTWGTDGTASTLQFGQLVWIERRARNATTLVWTEYAPRLPMPIASAPRKPSVSVADTVLRSDGTYVVGTTTPRIDIVYRSADLPDDSPSRRILIFRPEAGGLPVYTNDDTTAVPLVEAFDVPASTLVFETTYQLTVQHYNDVGVIGPESDVILVKVHQPPDIAEGTAPSATDPTPTFTWATTFYGTSIADHTDVWLEAKDAGGEWDEVHRETLEGDPETYTVPADVLRDGVEVRANIQVTGTDGLVAALEFSLDLDAAVTFSVGEAVLAAAADVSTVPATDTFTRSVSDGWGTAVAGGAYTLDGTAADFDVNGSAGTIVHTAVGTARHARLPSVAIADLTASVKVKSDKVAAGDHHAAGLAARVVDASNYYYARLAYLTTGAMLLQVQRVVAGVETSIAAIDLSSRLTQTAGQFYVVKLQVVGVGPTILRAKAWQDGVGEPGSWDIDTTDSTAALQVAAGIGIRTNVNGGATTPPLTFTVDDLTSTTP